MNYGRWVNTVCQCRFIGCSKCTALGGEGGNGESVIYGGMEYVEISVPFVQFCQDAKTALNIKSSLF